MAIDKVLRGIPFLRQELTKIFMKRAADKSGIMQIPFKNKKLQLDIEDRVQKYVRDAEKQGVDLDMVSNENLKYTINLNENVDPISRVISADSPEGRRITEMLLGKKGEVVDMTGKTMDTSQGILGGRSVAELMKSGQVTKGAKDMKKSKKVQDREMFEGANKKFNKASKADETQFFKDVDEAGGMEAFLDANPIPGPGGNLTKKFNETDNFVTNTITKIKSMKPMDAMKEANFVIGRKNKYKNLTPEQSKKILQDTEDHIFERDIPIDPEDMADGGVAGLLGERTGFKGGYLANGAKELGKKYKGSTLSAILENPKLLGAELGHDGIMALMKLLPSLFADGGPARTGYNKGLLVNEMLEMTYPDTYYKNVIEPAKLGKGPVPSKMQMLSKAQPFKAVSMPFQEMMNPGKFGAFRSSGTPLASKAIGAATGVASKFLGPTSFLFDATPVNADEIDGFDMKAMMAKEAQFKKKQQQTETFKQIEAAAAQKAAKEAAAKEAAAKEAAQRAATKQQAAQNKASGRGGYQSSWGGGGGGGFMGGSGTAAEMGSHAQGGLARQNFAMGKRAFLKLLAGTGAGIAGLKSGLLGVGKGGTKKAVTETVKQAAGSGGQVPPYFLNLVKKIKMLGDDTLATQDKAIAKKYKDYTMEEDFAGNIEIIKKGDDVVEDVFMSYKVDEVPVKGKKGSTKVEEYEEYTARPDAEGKMKDVEPGVPDEVVNEGTMFEDNMTEFGITKKADGGRIGLSTGGLARMLGE